MQNKLGVKDSSLAFILSFLIGQFIVAFVSVVAMIIFKASSTNLETVEVFFSTGFGYLILTLSLYTAILCVFLFLNKGKQNKIQSKPKFTKILFYILVSVACFLSLYPIVTCFDSLLYKLGVKINTLDYPLTTKNYFLSLISLVIVPAIVEELIFRGLIFKGLQKHGKFFSILVSAVMFSIFHMAISQTIYPLLMGMVFAVIMYYENNIYYCIIVHLLNNFLSLTLSYFNISLAFNHVSYIILAVILLIVFLAVLIFAIFKKRSHAKSEKLTRKEWIYLISTIAIMMIFWVLVNLS